MEQVRKESWILKVTVKKQSRKSLDNVSNDEFKRAVFGCEAKIDREAADKDVQGTCANLKNRSSDTAW